MSRVNWITTKSRYQEINKTTNLHLLTVIDKPLVCWQTNLSIIILHIWNDRFWPILLFLGYLMVNLPYIAIFTQRTGYVEIDWLS